MTSRQLFSVAVCLASIGVPASGVQTHAEQKEPDESRRVAAVERVVEDQLAAYNRRDLEAFLSYYADDAVLVDYPDRITQTGKEAMRARYSKRFANPDLHASVTKRIVFEQFVIDHEQVTTAPGQVLEAVAIYEIRDGRIARVTFLRK